MLESFFGKRRISFGSTKLEPAVSKQVRLNNREGKVEKPKYTKEPPASKVRENLKGSKFRLLNEYLYTNESSKSVDYFNENKELFEQYHEGFTQQMETWPSNPLHVIIRELSKNPVYNNKIICDLGCGEGKLYEHFKERNQILEDAEGQKVTEEPKKGNIFQKIYSFDLVSIKSHITACDISNLPLENKSIDVAVFSLALMGTNYLDFIFEAQRCLRMGGYLIIAEVLSRMPDRVLFVKLIKALGFKFVKYIKKNTFFVILIFRRVNPRIRNKEEKIRIQDFDKLRALPKSPKDFKNITLDEASKLFLLPCIYKRR